MNPAATSRMQLLARAGLALAACLLLLPAPGHAVTLNVTDDAFISLNNPIKNFGSRKNVKVDGLNGLEGFAKFDLLGLGGFNISSATLRIWITKVKVAGDIEIRRVLGAWDEDTLIGDDLFLVGGGPLTTFDPPPRRPRCPHLVLRPGLVRTGRCNGFGAGLA